MLMWLYKKQKIPGYVPRNKEEIRFAIFGKVLGTS